MAFAKAVTVGMFVPLALITAASQSSAPAVPSDLSALVRTSNLGRPVVGWCAGAFRTGRPGGYAVAVTSASGGGRYLVLESDTRSVELATYTGRPDVACYTPAEARDLNATIGASDTIDGELNPVWATTVVCGFVEDTRAVCWQHSPADGVFVKVGEWTT